MSYKECLIFIAYVKYFRTSSVPRSAGDRQVNTSLVPSRAAKDVPSKPHRTSPPRRRQKPKFTLEELLSQMPDYDLFCEVVKSGKFKPHRTPPPPRRRKPKFTLKELLTQMPDDGGHNEIDTGPPIGNEVW
ncbi:hypothetical protein F4141_24405 [Candidatus Poribacteria bacterium]|nr:hypothetical protein [Candidatus Poribacteria bacterium]MYH83837.1 hypothetical protein [Candidatus Poribacteria bacterium]